MNNQHFSGFAQIAMTVEKGFKRLDEVSIIFLIISNQLAERCLAKVSEALPIRQREDQLIDAQIANVERRIGLQTNSQLHRLHRIAIARAPRIDVTR